MNASPPSGRDRRLFLLILLAVCVLRAAFVLANYKGISVTWVSDSPTYFVEARRFVDFGVMDLCFRMPGYPLFIALAGRMNIPLILMLQALLGILTALLTYWGTSMVSGRSAARMAFAFAGLDLTSIVYGNMVLSEALFTPFAAAALFLLIGRPSLPAAAGSAILISAATYVRPLGAGIMVLWAVLLVVVLRDLRRAAVFSFLCALLLAPWFLRQKEHCGNFVLTVEQSSHFFFWNAGAIVADIEGISLETAHQRLESTPQARYSAEAWRLILAHPFRFLKLWAKAAAVNLISPAAGALRYMLPAAPLPLLLAATLAACLFWLWLPFTLGSLNKRYCIAAMATAIYFLIVTGPALASRFRVPAVPALAFCAAAGLQRFRGRRRPGAA